MTFRWVKGQVHIIASLERYCYKDNEILVFRGFKILLKERTTQVRNGRIDGWTNESATGDCRDKSTLKEKEKSPQCKSMDLIH